MYDCETKIKERFPPNDKHGNPSQVKSYNPVKITSYITILLENTLKILLINIEKYTIPESQVKINQMIQQPNIIYWYLKILNKQLIILNYLSTCILFMNIAVYLYYIIISYHNFIIIICSQHLVDTLQVETGNPTGQLILSRIYRLICLTLQYLTKLFQVDSLLKCKSFIDVVIAPVTLHIPLVKALVMDKVAISSQNVSTQSKGAFTGEVTAEQLKDFGIKWTLIGHSERRHLFGETNQVCHYMHL